MLHYFHCWIKLNPKGDVIGGLKNHLGNCDSDVRQKMNVLLNMVVFPYHHIHVYVNIVLYFCDAFEIILQNDMRV